LNSLSVYAVARQGLQTIVIVIAISKMGVA